MQKLRDLRKQFKFSFAIKSITMLQIMLIMIKKTKSLSEQLDEKITKTKIMLNVAIYSTSKFVEFNNVIINKLITINKHIYEILEQNIDVNKLPKKKQLEAYKIKSKIFKNVLQAYAKTINDAATKENNIDNVIKNNIIDLLFRRKNKNLFKKFTFDFYYAYKHLLTIFFANLNAENN